MNELFKAEKSTQQLSEAISSALLKHYKPSSTILPRIVRYIEQNKKFLLTTHIGADADGIGSEIALFHLLKKLKKDVIILNNEAIPESLGFIDPDNLVTNATQEGIEESDQLKLVTGRFVFILDSSELKRSARVAELFGAASCQYATIDHHILPKKDYFCVDPSYGATAEIIWDLYQYLKIKITKPAALALYTGLVADTGNFRYPKTSLRTHLAGGDLLRYALHSDVIYRALYESQGADRLKYLQRILKKAHLDKNLGVAIAEVRPRMQRGLSLGDSPNEGIVNTLLAAKEINISAVITQTKDGLKCSLRSKGDYDVAAVARQFGGGGHKNASGLKAVGAYRQLRRKLVSAIRASAK